MRIFFIFAWVALTMTVTVLSRERSKRDLSFLKKILELLFGTQKKLGSREHTRFYETHGRDNVLFKIIPKQSIKETEITVPKKINLEPIDLTLSHIRSYLGTKTSEETLDAIKQVKNLSNLGIFSEKENEEIQNVIVPLKPAYMKYAIKEKDEIYSIYSPIRTTVEKSEPSDIINYSPVITRESLTLQEIPIKSTRVRVSEIYNPRYSYKQTAQDGSVTTFKSEGDQNIIVTETEVIPPLPSYIKLRLEDVAAKCTTRIHCTLPISDSLSFSKYERLGIQKPNLNVSSTSKIKDNINKIAPLPVIGEEVENVNVIPDVAKGVRYSPAFGEFKKSGHFVGVNVDEPIIIEEGNPILKETTVTVLSKSGFKGVTVNVESNKKDNKSFRDNKDGKSEPKNNYEINNKQTDSQISYKQINHNVPAREEKMDTELVDSKIDKIILPEESNIIANNYLYVPPLIDNDSLNELNKTTRDDKDITNIAKLSDTFQDFKLEKKMPNKSEESKVEYSFIDQPIIVPDDIPYVSKQIKSDGSSITMKGNFQNVSFESKTNEENENVSGVIF